MLAIKNVEAVMEKSKGTGVFVNRTDLEKVVEISKEAETCWKDTPCPIQKVGVDTDRDFCDNTCPLSKLCDLVLEN